MYTLFLFVLILSNGQRAYANESDYEWDDNMDEDGNPDGTVTITKYVGSGGDVTIPGELGGNTVTRIGDYAFYNNNLTSVTLPDGLTGIQDWAFSNNNLTSVTLPDSLERIGDYAFMDNPLMDVTPTSKISYMSNSALSFPRKEGHVFAGWYIDSAFKIEWDKVPRNVTLYAKWIVNKHTITFDSKGGSAVPDIVVDYDTQIIAPTDPTKSGYIFAGWYTDTAFTI